MTSISIAKQAYGWNDWRTDHEEFVWDMFNALTNAIEDSNVTMLDQCGFYDFMNFCQRYTKRPIAICEPLASEDLEPEHQEKQESTDEESDFYDENWLY